MHNPIADMRGPDFLVLYACVIGIAAAVCLVVLYLRDQTRGLPKTPIAPELDPYEVAFLRGGKQEVLRLTLLDLIQRSYLEPSAEREKIERKPNAPSPEHLTPLEGRIYKLFDQPKAPSELFSLNDAAELRAICAPWESALQREKLLASEPHRRVGRGLAILAGALILGLGGYKLAVALAKERHNVLFLILMALGSVVILAVVNAICNGRLTARGKDYLKRLELAFQRLKSRTEYHGNTPDDLMLLAVGIFGIGLLSATPFDYYPKMFQRATSSGGCGSTCGSSCGGGSGCGGGGGCGGCGGD